MEALKTSIQSRHFFFLIVSFSALAATAGAIYVEQNKCVCVKQLIYDKVIIHEGGSYETKQDSICMIGGNSKGDLILTKFR